MAADMVLEPGMAFALEPNYAYGEHLAYLGGTVIVTDGPEVRSVTPETGRPGGARVNPGTRHLVPRAPAISWWILLLTTVAILMTSVDHQILPAVLPQVSEQYGLDAQQAGLISSVYFAGLGAGGLIFGYVSDRIGTGYRRSWVWNVAMLFAVRSPGFRSVGRPSRA